MMNTSCSFLGKLRVCSFGMIRGFQTSLIFVKGKDKKKTRNKRRFGKLILWHSRDEGGLQSQRSDVQKNLGVEKLLPAYRNV